MKWIDGGVTAPQGFRAAGVYAGIHACSQLSEKESAAFIQNLRDCYGKQGHKNDLALLCADVPCTAAGIFTSNLVKGAPIAVCKEHLKNGWAQAVVANSANANTCNADGLQKAEAMAEAAAAALHIPEEDVLVASTGVIGQPLPLPPILAGIPRIAERLSADGSLEAATAIMTTDRVPKNMAVEFSLGGKTVRIGGISKGSGMIHPNMCTMLCFLTTDAAVSAAALDKALRLAAKDSFNMLSVDEDMSTNDTCLLLADGAAGNEELTSDSPDFPVFVTALRKLCIQLARAMAKDGEGAKHLLVCEVAGAVSDADARKVAKAIVCSSLVKAAIFGADANWGRVLCAVGYCGANVDVHKVDVDFSSPAGTIPVCRSGAGVPFDEDRAKEILLQDEITVMVTLHDGTATATAYGCDLTYDYVKINGDYRT
ncbi:MULTISPECIES: bifunctional glutamate N-acetyltransferase/amino-acid acetyltransferase ArgJ [Caproicibacterium]|uniref:Arginine biosynthesis bifunctional protein ArgJ n=1 Tax=Caproicibacterium lactatifermentans TaxID=2666138 RepID=A0A859DNP2_9FIRM|nr:bifunctional glutamate N-acetyltransferase/amino-acid acetyltransferase ArgJ [Caproicibacterium lactatifermentans]ARP49547.1 bifunctional ornithine acetyltransferase/N-acetylglutamate synthase [Ruminococcaceae bacterium CPB6]MDD4807845.1 bifunctional glutamate N-acetyltransferase/amino-acid acetyltransferase ArgJ [Oscillospiraceae bacterium]QKN23134.1 bifunctional glutamate N-acetyltransferase/amino-acid acetyltransferase ArgJ [Caproicibacterium lactatifermentans]QKO31178.1 bifunctional glut